MSCRCACVRCNNFARWHSFGTNAECTRQGEGRSPEDREGVDRRPRRRRRCERFKFRLIKCVFAGSRRIFDVVGRVFHTNTGNGKAKSALGIDVPDAIPSVLINTLASCVNAAYDIVIINMHRLRIFR